MIFPVDVNRDLCSSFSGLLSMRNSMIFWFSSRSGEWFMFVGIYHHENIRRNQKLVSRQLSKSDKVGLTLSLASSVVNCHLTFAFLLFLQFSHANTSFLTNSDVIHSSIQTLPCKHVQLNFCHIQPAPVLRSIDKFKSIP